MKRTRIRKAAAVFLTAFLAAELMPVLPDMGSEAHAAGPDVTAFATREQLADDANFSMDRNKSGSVQKVYFGQDGAGNAQEWYIAGAEPAGGNANGLVLFAASPLGAKQMFDSTGDEKKAYSPDWGCNYSAAPSAVSVNHYGGSDLRRELKKLEGDTSYFTGSENRLMQETTIATGESKSPETTYTTTDKLYAATRDIPIDRFVVGTNSEEDLTSGLKISIGKITGESFWLRSPYDNGSRWAYDVWPAREAIGYAEVNVSNAVRPAFSLNLTSVLFASAAPAAGSDGSLATGDAFTLRYQSTTLGTAVIRLDKASVAVSGAPADTYLVVQNAAGAWAKSVSGTTTVRPGDMGEGLTSFADCKVWLETTDADRITTAALATEEEGYRVTATPDIGMSRAAQSGAESQIVTKGSAITDIVYEANAGYCFPEGYSVGEVNGITVTRNSEDEITVSGTPTADTDVALAPATADATPVPAEAPQIIDGADGRWTKGSSSGLTITSDADFSAFQYVTVDGRKIAESNYTVKPGSTIVTLKPEYLDSLSAGEHTIGIVSANGTAETTITIAAKGHITPSGGEAGKPAAPSTSDSSGLFLWLAITLLAAILVAISLRIYMMSKGK